jgi:hypothetical protein
MPGRDLSAELFGDQQAQSGGRDLSAELGMLSQAGGAGPTISSLITGKRPPMSKLERVGQGAMDPINGGAQLLTHILPDSVVNAGNKLNNWLADKTGLVARVPEGGVDQMVRDQEAAYQARRNAGGESGFDGYRVLGNIVSPVSLGLGAAAPAGMATLAGRVGVGAASGAVSGALSPVTSGDFWSEKGKQALTGAAVGGAIPAIVGGAARLVSPNASKNTNLQMLKDEGVQPTIGQALGGRANALEEKLQSVPIVGDAISNARGRALKQFNQAAINRASNKVGAEVDDIGQAGVREAGDKISQAYDDALNQITGVQLDPQFNNNLLQLRGMAQGLTTTMRNKFNNAINETVMRKVSRTGAILPGDYKAIDSELGNLAARYGKSPVASEQELGDAVTQLQSLLKQQMMRTNPQVADQLQAADAAWANLVRVEGAAKSAKNAEGVFTPGQLNMAVQAADQSVRKRAVSRGTALLQDLGNAGQSVLGNKVPNSFTTDRALIAGGTLGSYFVNPAIPAALLGGAGLYTSPLQRALVGAASSRPTLAQPTADLLRKSAPYLVPAGTQLGLAVGQQ